MTIQRKWKPGGRPRKSSTTKRWLLQQESLGGKEMERLLNEPPLVPSKRMKKGE